MTGQPCSTRPPRRSTGAAIIATILADGDAVVDSIEAALGAHASEGAIWLQMSTIGERGMDRCRSLASERGLTLVVLEPGGGDAQIGDVELLWCVCAVPTRVPAEPALVRRLRHRAGELPLGDPSRFAALQPGTASRWDGNDELNEVQT